MYFCHDILSFFTCSSKPLVGVVGMTFFFDVEIKYKEEKIKSKYFFNLLLSPAGRASPYSPFFLKELWRFSF